MIRSRSDDRCSLPSRRPIAGRGLPASVASIGLSMTSPSTGHPSLVVCLPLLSPCPLLECSPFVPALFFAHLFLNAFFLACFSLAFVFRIFCQSHSHHHHCPAPLGCCHPVFVLFQVLHPPSRTHTWHTYLRARDRLKSPLQPEKIVNLR